jgi:hypothetical protein
MIPTVTIAFLFFHSLPLASALLFWSILTYSGLSSKVWTQSSLGVIAEGATTEPWSSGQFRGIALLRKQVSYCAKAAGKRADARFMAEAAMKDRGSNGTCVGRYEAADFRFVCSWTASLSFQRVRLAAYHCFLGAVGLDAR